MKTKTKRKFGAKSTYYKLVNPDGLITNEGSARLIRTLAKQMGKGWSCQISHKAIGESVKSTKTTQINAGGGIMVDLVVAKAKVEKKPHTPKAPAIYAGAAIPALQVYRRDMPEFKNCKAETWLMVGEKTYTFANTYNGLLKSSFDAKHYTYTLTPKAQKKIDKKVTEMVEVEVIEWPTFITNAAGIPKKAVGVIRPEKKIRVRLAK